jgi:hypothetical protein
MNMNPVSLDDVFAFDSLSEPAPVISARETQPVKRHTAAVSRPPNVDPMLKPIGLPAVARGSRESKADMKFATLNASLSELNSYMARLEANLEQTATACSINDHSYPVWAIALIGFLTALVVAFVSYFLYNEWKSRS